MDFNDYYTIRTDSIGCEQELSSAAAPLPPPPAITPNAAAAPHFLGSPTSFSIFMLFEEVVAGFHLLSRKRMNYNDCTLNIGLCCLAEEFTLLCCLAGGSQIRRRWSMSVLFRDRISKGPQACCRDCERLVKGRNFEEVFLTAKWVRR